MLAQPKTDELIEKINAHQVAGEKFSEFEGAKFLRDIKKLPSDDERHMLYALYYAIQKDKERTVYHFEQALFHSGHEIQVCENYLMALESLSMYKKALSESIKFSNMLCAPEIVRFALINSLSSLSIPKFEKQYIQLDKMNKLNIFDDLDCILAASSELKCFCENNRIDFSIPEKIGSIIDKCLEKFSISRYANTIAQKREQEELTILFRCESASVSTSVLLDMNDYFINELIENDLDHYPFVVSFVRGCREA